VPLVPGSDGSGSPPPNAPGCWRSRRFAADTGRSTANRCRARAAAYNSNRSRWIWRSGTR